MSEILVPPPPLFYMESGVRNMMTKVYGVNYVQKIKMDGIGNCDIIQHAETKKHKDNLVSDS